MRQEGRRSCRSIGQRQEGKAKAFLKTGTLPVDPHPHTTPRRKARKAGLASGQLPWTTDDRSRYPDDDERAANEREADGQNVHWRRSTNGPRNATAAPGAAIWLPVLLLQGLGVGSVAFLLLCFRTESLTTTTAQTAFWTGSADRPDQTRPDLGRRLPGRFLVCPRLKTGPRRSENPAALTEPSVGLSSPFQPALSRLGPDERAGGEPRRVDLPPDTHPLAIYAA